MFSTPFDPLTAEHLFLSFWICQCLCHAYNSDFHLAPTDMTLWLAHQQLLGSYITSLDNTSVFGLDDIQHVLLQHSSLDHPLATLVVTVALEHISEFDDHPPPLHLWLHDLHHIAALQLLDGVGMPINVQLSLYSHVCTALDAFEADLHDVNMAQLPHHLQHAGMMEEERSLRCFTCCQLMKLQNWPKWDKAFDAQLDAHLKAGCIGAPVP